MIINNSKKDLAAKIRNSGFVWPDSGKWAIQDKDGEVFVCSGTSVPVRRMGEANWEFGGPYRSVGILSLGSNWFQCILSRAEYLHLYPAPDADGWIEWSGGECPVKRGTLVDVKYANGLINIGVSALTDKSHADHISGTAISFNAVNWDSGMPISGIIAYRLHKPEQAEPEFCESVMRSIPEPEIHSKNTALTQVDDIGVVELRPTIEQLAAEYRNAKGCAARKQKEADDAKAYAEAKLADLIAAGKELGLALSVAAPELELVITDWRDLRLGDEIATNSGRKLTVKGIRMHDESWPIYADDNNGSDYWCVSAHDWRFIRRP